MAVFGLIVAIAVAGGVLTGFAHGDSIQGTTFPANPDQLSGEVVSSIDYYGAIGFGLAAVAGVASLRWRRAVLLVLFLGSFLTLSQYISWAAYRSVTHDDPPSNSFGVFDWLLGAARSDNSFSQRWQRNIAGLSLWGAAVTAAPGLLLLLAGYSPMLLLAGWALGPTYVAARALHPYSNWESVLGGGNQATAFFMFGVWLFGATLLLFTAHAASGAAPDKLPSLKTHDSAALQVATLQGCTSVFRGTCPLPLCGGEETAHVVWATTASTLSGPPLWLLHVYCVLMQCMLALSLVSVNALPDQSAWRIFKKDQSTGLGGALGGMLLLHIALIWQQYKYYHLVRRPLSDTSGSGRGFVGLHTRLLAGGTAPSAASSFSAWMPSTSQTVNTTRSRSESEDSSALVPVEDVLVFLPGRGNEHMCCRCDCRDGCTDERWEADGFEPQGNVWCSRSGCASGVSSCCILFAAAEPYQLVPLPAYADWQEGGKGGAATTAGSLDRAGSVGALCPKRRVPGWMQWNVGGGFGDGVPRDAPLATGGGGQWCGCCAGGREDGADTASSSGDRGVVVPVPFMLAWGLHAALLVLCAAWALASTGLALAAAARGEHQFGV